MIIAMWAGHTPRSYALSVCVRDAIKACGWKDEYAAHLLKLAPAQFSRQLAGVEPLNLWRVAELPDDFQREYDKRRAASRGAVVLEAPDLSLVRGFAAMPKQAMVKMTTPERVDQKRNSQEGRA